MNRIRAKGTALFLALVMVLGLAGCGVRISGLNLPADLVLEKGETRQMDIQYSTEQDVSTPEMAKAAEKLALTWTSSDETVATVDDTGLVTAVGAGEADITATAEKGGLSATTHLKVVILPQGLTAPETLTLELNGENAKPLGAVMTPEDATEVKLAYESSDESVATVAEDGTVTAVGVGECTITTTIVSSLPATAENAVDPEMLVSPDGFTAVTNVTVTKRMESLAFDSTEGVLTVGSTHRIQATVTPADATDQTLTWASSDETVATVDTNGKVTAKAAGSATITARNAAGDVSASYALTVKNLTCSYCGQTGHTSASCPVKAADQQRAAQAAAQQQSAAQAAQQQAAAQAAQQQAEAQSQPDPEPAPNPAPSGDSGISGNISHPEADIPGEIIMGGGNGDGAGEVPPL